MSRMRFEVNINSSLNNAFYNYRALLDLVDENLTEYSAIQQYLHVFISSNVP